VTEQALPAEGGKNTPMTKEKTETSLVQILYYLGVEIIYTLCD
jgi:hypothetical protein